MSKVDLKVVLLGHEFVGKTSLIERYINQRFNEDCQYQVTIGAVFIGKTVIASNGKKITVGVWDTAGSERYQAISKIYYRGAKAAIVCFDICQKLSWDKAKFWVTELRNQVEECKVYMCGTKCDLVNDGVSIREVDLEQIEKYVDGIESTYFETSSKTGENVDRLFQTVVNDFACGSARTGRIETLQLHVDEKRQKCC
ncbi:hypothetical protein J437_LFUL017110 [Ladona fulva]|uniref:Ras-related protein Rab-24 n=1 Tax=Ladona fulva TaxID=123851 RepID=A0A8K0PAY5_LADFU|nr:hypothetical protein J437_LFUL017110 [Ladona fulva]